MAKMSPLQEVKQRFESKEALVKQLVDRLHRRSEEDAKSFAKRLVKASNKKLLKLYDTTAAVYERFGAKADLVESVLKLERPTGAKVDAPFKDALSKLNHAELLDRYRGLAKRAARQKKAD